MCEETDITTGTARSTTEDANLLVLPGTPINSGNDVYSIWLQRRQGNGYQPSGGEMTWQILEGHGLAEDCVTQANLEVAC